MTDTATELPAARLWTKDGFQEDEWTRGDSADALRTNHRVILPLRVFVELDEAVRSAVANRIAVEISPDEELDAVLPYLAQLNLISLIFPAFSDGRSYSKAQLLRQRHGFKGSIRAAGDVLIDQLPLMIRTGFSEFEIINETALRRLEVGRPGGIEYHFQPAAVPETLAGGYSWRRLPAS